MLLYNGPGEAFMLVADSLEAGKALCAGVEAMEIATAHDGETGAFLRDRYQPAGSAGLHPGGLSGKRAPSRAPGV